MTDGVPLLLPTRFAAYRLGKVPWGLPYQFLQYPYAIVLFDKILCDKWGLTADVEAYENLGWTSGWVFSRLTLPTGEDILQPVDFQEKYPRIFAPMNDTKKNEVLRRQDNSKSNAITHLDMIDANYLVAVAALEKAVPFGWTSPRLDIDPSDTLRKAEYYFDKVFLFDKKLRYFPVMPPFESLSPEAKRQLEEARTLEAPLWDALERGNWHFREYQKKRAEILSSKPKHRIVDEELFETTEKRLRLILDMRRSFRDVRSYIRKELIEFESGNVTVEQFQRDLDSSIPPEIEQFDLQVTPLERDFSVRVILMEILMFFSIIINRAVSPTDFGSFATMTGADAFLSYERYRDLKRKLPNGYLNHRFSSRIKL